MVLFTKKTKSIFIFISFIFLFLSLFIFYYWKIFIVIKKYKLNNTKSYKLNNGKNIMNKQLFLLSVGIFLIGLIFAAPQIPHVVVGEVIFSGDENASLDAYEVKGYIGEVYFSTNIDSNNEFELWIDNFGSGVGEEVIFYVENVSANSNPLVYYEVAGSDEVVLTINEMPTAEIICGNGIKEIGEYCDGNDLGNLMGSPANCGSAVFVENGIEGYEGNLSCTSLCTYDTSECYLPDVPFCGDGECNNGETCSSCSVDCGSCTTSRGSSGGGSSSTRETIVLTGNSSSECVESWDCTEWSECANGKQSRTCTDKNDCGTEKEKPLEEQNCVQNILVSDEKKGAFAGITGAVIGTIGEHKGVTAVVILLILAGATIMIISRKKLN